MIRKSGMTACLFFLPLTTFAATRTYEVAAFEAGVRRGGRGRGYHLGPVPQRRGGNPRGGL